MNRQLRQEKTELQGCLVLHPKVFEDPRGFFMEVYNKDEFSDLGLPPEFQQDNHSRSQQNVVRGLHCQWNPYQGKLIRVTLGTAFVVTVDIRKNSPTLGKWFGTELSADNKKMIWAPPAGFATGFCVLSDFAEVQYKCTGVYNPECEASILWNDPEIGVEWPVSDPLLSERDKNGMKLSDWLQTKASEDFQLKS